MALSFHEDFTLREIKPGSDRSFGLVIGGAFAVIGLIPILHDGPPRLWCLGLAVAFLVAALAIPRSLRHLNLLWFRLGIMLGKIVLPLFMAILFFVLIAPLAMVRRKFGRPGLALELARPETTYWISRETPPDLDSLKRQF